MIVAGLHGCFVQIRSSSLTGSYVMEMAEQREPYEIVEFIVGPAHRGRPRDGPMAGCGRMRWLNPV
jgi:hypothetical protein